tara:strand:+ start:238 stop:366 length:129 start_codon:yes stop_codon:yes gene_type:complete
MPRIAQSPNNGGKVAGLEALLQLIRGANQSSYHYYKQKQKNR